MARVDENYFLCNMADQKVSVLSTAPPPNYQQCFLFQSVASELNCASLSIIDHFIFSRAPVDSDSSTQITAIREV
jgi:hypothetical protein